MSDSDEQIYTPEVLERVTSATLMGMGAPEDLAHLVAESLVLSNLVGHDSHGIIRLMEYSGWVKAGTLIPHARPEVLWKREGTALIDGHWGWGQATAALANTTVIELAKEFGSATVVLRQSHHIGRMGEYVDQMADAGLMGIAVCNTGGAVVAPFGGVKPVLGTNPFAWGLPGPQGHNYVLDFSTAVVAAGKVVLAAMNGEEIAPGSLIDKNGNPSTRAADLEEGGALLTFGGHKGSGMSVLIDVAAGVLSGNMPATLADNGFGNGTIFMATDISRFVELSMLQSISQLFEGKMKGSSPSAGPKVLLPGEHESNVFGSRSQKGIAVSNGVRKNIVGLASEFGVSLPEFE